MASHNIDIRSKLFFKPVQILIISLVLLISPVPVQGRSLSLALNYPEQRNNLITWEYPIEQGSIYYRNYTQYELKDFRSFVESVWNGQRGLLRGVYVPGGFATPIVQQPAGNPGFVSQNIDEITQFSMAAEAGNVGLLAHNYLSGKSFTKLYPGQEVRLVYGDGAIEYFVVDEIFQYQALDPYNPSGDFKDLETNLTLSAEQLFHKVYRGGRHVTFQTCIEANGNSSWGRIFILAHPKLFSY